MIKILFPPGCYGTYLAQSVYTYTNLRKEEYAPFDFDTAGSSHVYRKNINAKQVVWHGHLDTFSSTNLDQTIIILPNQHHRLDYYNNQFHKQQKQQLVEYILSQLSIDEINHKLKSGWGYNNSFDENVPRWILREFFSLWITMCFADGYSVEKYKNIPNQITVDAQDIISNFNNILTAICQECGLTITVDQDSIEQNHANFLKSQHYLDSQIGCEQWVNDTIIAKDCPTPVKTIFDEAYIQHVFRIRGYEIKCDGLNHFPTSTFEMKPLIYENSYNHNP
jgi:hypothetical protein